MTTTATTPAPSAFTPEFISRVHAAILADDVDAINEMIGHGVTYWGRNVTPAERDGIPEGAECVFWDVEADRLIALTADDIRNAFVALLDPSSPWVNTYGAGYVREAWNDRAQGRDAERIDAAHIDSEAGDIIAQVAAHGGVIYG